MKRIATTLALLALSAPALADEGMWTFDNFPAAKVKEAYGFEPDQAWLDQTRLSSARLANGCSASFVSSQGLVMTNHHCVHTCVEQLSTAKSDLVENGFYAKTLKEEKRCPAFEANQLLSITDVSSRLEEKTRGLQGAAYAEAMRSEKSRIEKECAESDSIRCDVVTLYKGGQNHLYKYRRFQDVRLVFVPEIESAFFGGDPDNFVFPRYNLDLAFLRVYENDQPVQMETWFPWSPAGVKEGDLTFVSGHPGSTSRLLSVSELAFERDVVLPRRLLYWAELRGILTEYSRKGAEQKRVAKTPLFGIENGVKAFRGRYDALLDPALFSSKQADEQKLREWVASDPKRAETWASAWGEMDAAQLRRKELYDLYNYAEGGPRGLGQTWGFQSRLFGIAKTLNRAADERQKPNEQRLREFNDANLPALQAQLFSEAPIYDELEQVMLTYSLTKLRETLGPDHEFVKLVLGKSSPETLAKQLVKNTRLKNQKDRKALWEGGSQAVAASKDPMIEMARRIDSYARDVRARYESEVDATVASAGERIAKARFAAYGTSTYPDATFTLRLSYGSVEGYEENGHRVNPVTVIEGLYERATGEDPYKLPKSWIQKKDRLNLQTPMNFASSNDIIGGNSGSPVINQKGEVVGLIFDGNLQSLGGEYGFEPATNRAVSVHSAAIIESLDKVYGATRLLEELRPVKTSTR